MLKVGLTGGMGSGKSSVARRLGELGCVVIDADAIAREIVEPGQPALQELADAFGPDILDAEGRLLRSRLANRAFTSKEKTATLNAITHPRIKERTAERFARAGDKDIVVHDMPLLVENDLAADHHIVLVVDAPVETRVNRLVESRGVDEADARRRIASQISDEERLAAADAVIDNSGTERALFTQVDRVWRTRLVPMSGVAGLAEPQPVRSPGRIDREIARVTRQLGVGVVGSVLSGKRLVLTVDGEPSIGDAPWRLVGTHWENLDPGNPVTLVRQETPALDDRVAGA
ncbi:dephospho-CoA kinase [Corynebacterium sp. NPDC060344]|uniref:dephospho-CoA kinase n=1 Tax=Corynebacterium sp. NPDC060344 TaxID=3347101 RepID=UPI0036631B10